MSEYRSLTGFLNQFTTHLQLFFIWIAWSNYLNGRFNNKTYENYNNTNYSFAQKLQFSLYLLHKSTIYLLHISIIYLLYYVSLLTTSICHLLTTSIYHLLIASICHLSSHCVYLPSSHCVYLPSTHCVYLPSTCYIYLPSTPTTEEGFNELGASSSACVPLGKQQPINRVWGQFWAGNIDQHNNNYFALLEYLRKIVNACISKNIKFECFNDSQIAH